MLYNLLPLISPEHFYKYLRFSQFSDPLLYHTLARDFNKRNTYVCCLGSTNPPDACLGERPDDICGCPSHTCILTYPRKTSPRDRNLTLIASQVLTTATAPTCCVPAELMRLCLLASGREDCWKLTVSWDIAPCSPV
jgi:hypothetical protein